MARPRGEAGRAGRHHRAHRPRRPPAGSLLSASEPGAAPPTGSRLDQREWKLLGLLGAASFLQHYHEGLISLLLVQIQAELAIPEASLGWIGSAVRLGTLPALGVLLVADRVGRRAVLMASIAGYTVFTAATALAPNAESFVAFQFLARIFLASEFGLALVVVAEELRPGNRGFGVAVLGTLAVSGRGVGMLLFAFVDSLPHGWRDLYAVGLVPLLLLMVLRRNLPETSRFTRSAADRSEEWLRPLRVLVRRHPLRFAAVGAVSFLWSFSNGSVDFFLPKLAQDAHGWQPSQFATVAILGGALGLTGQLLAGWVSDRRGRKGTTLLFFTLEPLLAILLYSAGPAVFVGVYVVWVFSSVANDVLGRTYASELFPTAARATALGAVGIFATLGGVLGLACEGTLYAPFGSHWPAVRVVASAGLLIPLIVWLVYPETSGRTLEEIAPDAEGGGSVAQDPPARGRSAPP